MNDTNTLQAIHGLRTEVSEMFKGLNKSIDARINNVVQASLTNSIQFHTNTKQAALEKITLNKPLTVDQLTQLYRQLLTEVTDFKSTSNNIAVYEQMQNINRQFEKVMTEFNWVKNTLNQLIADKYIECDISHSELTDLYNKSEVGPDAVARRFNISKDMFYKIIIGRNTSMF